MKYREIIEAKEQYDVETPTLAQLVAKHNTDKETLQAQLDKGIKVELEHTTDKAIAKEIALDHLNEFPDYYDRLEKTEEE